MCNNIQSNGWTCTHSTGVTCITDCFFLLWLTLVNTNVDCEQSTPVTQLLSARTNKKKSLHQLPLSEEVKSQRIKCLHNNWKLLFARANYFYFGMLSQWGPVTQIQHFLQRSGSRMVAQGLALLPHDNEEVLGSNLSWGRAFHCGICMFHPCSCGFFSGIWFL